MPHEPRKNSGCLGFLGGYTTQLCRDYNEPHDFTTIISEYHDENHLEYFEPFGKTGFHMAIPPLFRFVLT